MKRVETDEFQSGDTCIYLNVDTLWRTYDISLYRDWNSMHVWFDWDFAYEVDLNSGWFKRCVTQLFQNWRWVPGIFMEWHWSQSDPYLQWNRLRANYREVEDYLYEDFIDWLFLKIIVKYICKVKEAPTAIWYGYKVLLKLFIFRCLVLWGCGGIGRRARLRGVW